ncbi:MAG: hypothetical protein ACYDBB_00865 [Armatimonadota bacterium]
MRISFPRPCRSGAFAAILATVAKGRGAGGHMRQHTALLAIPSSSSSSS